MADLRAVRAGIPATRAPIEQNFGGACVALRALMREPQTGDRHHV